jgi:DNA repair photolyase
MTRFSKTPAAWGQFCDVKVNAVDVLRRQLPKMKKGLVSLSTVTDPYQAPERKYGLTRAILIDLAASEFPVSILTKSDLVLRDLDVLKRFDPGSCDVGFSMATYDEAIRRHFEPGAPSVQKRIDALNRLHRSGIRTWIFITPILPYFTENTLLDLLDSVRHSVDSILVDRLNIKCGNWQTIGRVLSTDFPSLVPKWKQVLFSEINRDHYFQVVFDQIRFFCEKNRIPVETC